MFNLTTYGGYDVLSQTGAISNNRYLYTKVLPDFDALFKYSENDATVEFILFDDVPGQILLQYSDNEYPYQTVPSAANLIGSKQWTNISFDLSLPTFKHEQNNGTDFRTAREADGSPNIIIREIKVTQISLNEQTETQPTADINNAMARVYCTNGSPLAENIRYIKLVFRSASTSGSIMELYPSSDPILSPVLREIDIIGTTEPSKATSAKSFALTNHIISTSFFHWYKKNSGQLSGIWRPRDGRASWSGESGWWKTQIKQVMLAGIDVMYVHLIPSMEQQRINLFRALAEMRYDGYDVPKVAPFLDPIITWNPNTYSLAIESNRIMIVDQYIRFFNQYYSVNNDKFADDYIDVIDNRVALDVWHLGNNFTSISSFQRSDMENPLAAEFGAEHPVFSNGIYQITTESGNTFSFADEQVRQFQSQDYSHITDYNGIKSDQLKPGYWDQNIRNPGTCFKRDGGTHYSNSWVTFNC